MQAERLPRLTPIGVPQGDYNVQRNIVDSLPAWSVRVRPMDPCRLLTAVGERIAGQARSERRFSFREPFWPRVRILHLFNSIAFTSTPWVCSFETMLPRWGDVVLPDWDIGEAALERAVRAMRADSCRALIAISDAARRLLVRRWRTRLPADAAVQLESKVQVLLPPQAILVHADDRAYSPVPRFLFVGSEFYRKGGMEFLRCLDRIAARGERGWSAVVVGRLDSFGDRASRTSDIDRDEAQVILARLSGLVEHHRSLPRDRVLAELARADFYVLPTLQDSFGYGVLEAQANGAVVICSNVRALPEMVGADTGFLIDLPLDADGEVHHRAESMPAIKERLAAGLESALAKALSMHPDDRRAMALRAQRQLGDRFGVVRHRQALDRLYRSCL